MKNAKKVLIVGGKGSGEMAASVFEAMRAAGDGQWAVAGFLTDIRQPGERIGIYPVLGGTREILDFIAKGYYIHYTLHCTSKDKSARIEKYRELNVPLEALASAVHPAPSWILRPAWGKGS